MLFHERAPMGFNAAELSVKLSIDTADLDRGLRDADARLRQFGRNTDSAGRQGAAGVDRLGEALRGVRGALQAVGVAVSLASIARLGADAIGAANALEKTDATVRALAGSTARYQQVLSTAQAGQQRYGGSLNDNLSSLGRLVNLSNRTGVELGRLDNLMRRLATVDPLQGVEGAGYALKELFSNQGATATLSLRNRFELDRSVLKSIEDESATAAEKVEALDSALNQLGITNEVLSNSTSTTAASYDRLAAAADNLKVAVGGGLADAFERPAVGLTRILGLMTGSEQALAEFNQLLGDDVPTAARNAEVGLQGIQAAQETYRTAVDAGIPPIIAIGLAMDAMSRGMAKATVQQGTLGKETAVTAAVTQQAADALYTHAAESLTAAANAEALDTAQRQLHSASLLAAQGLLGSGDQALILAARYNIAYEEAQALIAAQQKLLGLSPDKAGKGKAVRAGRAVTASEQEARDRPRRGAGGGGAGRISEAENTAERLIEIEEQTAQRLKEIDERVVQQRIAAQRRLAAELITSANDFAVNAQANDLELIGATGKDAERLADRERAEAQARISYVKAVDEAKRVAAEGDAELARDTYEVRQDQIAAQQQLDEEYYQRARELPAEQQEALKKEYDEATAAIAQSAADRISLAEAEAAARAQAIEDEKAATIAAGQEQAAALQRTGESATTAKGQVEALGGALTSLPTNVTTTVTVRTVNEGEAAPASSGKGEAKPAKGSGGGKVAAAGGGRFVTRGPTHLTVGDNPGGRELVTVTPLSGRGQTRYSGNVIALAGGGEVDVVGDAADVAQDRLNRGSSPATGSNEPAAKPRHGRSQADIDRDWATARARILDLERRYLIESEKLEDRHFWQQTEADLWRFRREREVKRQWKEQQDALDRAQQAREDELVDQLRNQAEQRQQQAVTAAERSIGDARLGALSEAERRYIAKGTDIVADGASAQNDVASFWQTVRLADTSAAYQEERARINEEYDQRREETLDRVRSANEDISQEAEEAARLQAEREFQAAQDALEDQQFISERSWERLWDNQSDITERGLATELELHQAFWKNLFELIPGGADAWANLQKREAGGPVRAGMPYVVGERRPELFIPDTNGRILPEVAGGGVLITIPIDLRGATGVTTAQVRAVEEAGYRGAKKALAEAGRRADKMMRTGGSL